jgi:ankyrin repeat protein
MAPHDIDVQEDSDTDYKDDDSLDEPAPFLAKDPVQVAFDEIIDNARKERLNLGRKENRKEFMDRYGDLLLGKTQADNQTLLHVIANTLGHKSLTRCIVKMDPSLLKHKDDSGKTPLHIAIAKKNFNFLDVIDGQIKDLDPLLRLRGEMSRNCIHMAIYYGLGESYALNLIERASEETLSAVDQCGMTPLHLAVEYERSSSPQVNIVMALLRHGDEALDQFTSTPKDLSVYEYHVHTRAQAARKLASSLAPQSADVSRLYKQKTNVGTDAQTSIRAALTNRKATIEETSDPELQKEW